MAFNLNPNNRNNVSEMPFGRTNSQQDNRNQRNFEPAAAFLNIGIPRADGTTAKVGKGIPLRLGNKTEKFILEQCQTEEGMQKLINALVIEIRSADGSDSAEFDIG